VGATWRVGSLVGVRATLLGYATVMALSVAAALTSRSLREITLPGREVEGPRARLAQPWPTPRKVPIPSASETAAR